MKGKLIMTVEQMHNENNWLDMRTKGIGGTDAGVIIGLNQWKSPFSLWAEKTGQVEPEDLSDNQRVYWGKVNEQNIATWFEEVTGKKTRRCGMLQCDDCEYFFANVDRLIVGEEAGLEIKTAGVQASKQWKDGNVPNAYFCQCQWYMYITGFRKWYIAVLIGGNNATWTEIRRDDEFIEMLVEKAHEFWKLVETKTLPEVDGSDSCKKILHQKFQGGEEMIALPAETQSLINAILNYKNKIK